MYLRRLRTLSIRYSRLLANFLLSTGKFTTDEEIERSGKRIAQAASEILSAKTTAQERDQNMKVRLTHYTHGLGCACKISPDQLDKILSQLPLYQDPKILIDAKNSDDAAVYKLSDDTAIIQTVDFITPVVDDAFDFGAIAAANALSDIYAMGGDPLFALNIVGFPVKRLSLQVLNMILEGARTIAAEANVNILGGHTIEDSEPKFGMAVTGIGHPENILSNNNAQPGDVLILTKPVGTGIITTGIKKGQVNEIIIKTTIDLMKQLNKSASVIAKNYPVNACTDITGFGLLGHLLEMLKASHKSAEIYHDQVPVIPGAEELVQLGLIPGGTKKNKEFYSQWLLWKDGVAENKRVILCDAQTSGGLLFSIPEKNSKKLLQNFRDSGIECASVIGHILDDRSSKITIH